MQEQRSQQRNAARTTVIICTRNRYNDIMQFLPSLAEQTALPDELIIVDSSDVSLQESHRFVEQFSDAQFPTVQLRYLHTKPGLTYQRNVGIDHATGDILYFFDDDVVLDKDYLEQMNGVFEQHPEYAGGMGTVHGMPQAQYGWYWAIQRLFLLQRNYASGNFTWSGMPTHAYGTNSFKRVEVLGGCCMAYRAEAVRTHRFDETLGRYAYMEDCDVSLRVSRIAPLFFNPAARLIHTHSPVARDKIVDNRAMYIKNYTYLFFKNVYPTNRLKIIAYCWTVMGLFIQALLCRNIASVRGYWKGIMHAYSVVHGT